MPSSKSAYDLHSGIPSQAVREDQIEYGFIGKLQGLKYEYRPDIRDRAALERNFPNRLGKNTNVYLGSAELSAIASKLGRIPTKAEYLADMGVLSANGDKIYKYMNFDQIAEYKDVADGVSA